MIFDFPESAFAPFFDQAVAVTGIRPGGGVVRGTFAACVMPAERVDPFAETDADSKLFKRVVLISKVGDRAWNLPAPPQIGDGVQIGTSSWKVTNVDPHTDEYFSLEVRSC